LVRAGQNVRERPLPRIGVQSDRSRSLDAALRRSAGEQSFKSSRPESASRVEKRLAVPVLLFLVGMAIPWILFVGSMRISAYRLVLICMVLPCLLKWLLGKAGRIRAADLLALAFPVWCGISLSVVHGPGPVAEAAGIMIVETAGAYFLARCYIRTEDDFRNMVRALFWAVAVLLPFAVIEAVSGRNVALTLAGLVAPTLPFSADAPRWGLRRVQTVLEHPILFGVFCSSILAMTHLVLGRGAPFVQRWMRTGVVGTAAFLSLSAGPLTAMTAQTMLLLWNWFLGAVEYRWKLLWLAVGASYVFVAGASNQSVPAFYVTHFSFDKHSAYFRLLIWDAGSQSVLNHPLFGTGFGEWDRPSWMPPSIDMFWLANAVFYGLPGGLLMAMLFLAVCIPVSLRKGLGGRAKEYRTAYLIAMTGFALVGWTVHFWNASYVLLIFLLGSGVWFLDAPAEQDSKRTPRA
jgi:hypothetical protein